MKTDESIKRLRNLSLYDLKELIRKARAMDLANISSEAIDARVGKIMDGYQTNCLNVAMNGVFRARCIYQKCQDISPQQAKNRHIIV